MDDVSSDSNISTRYAAIRYGSTPDNSRYVLSNGHIIGAVCRAYDGTWNAYSAAQILDMHGSLLSDAVSMEIAIAAVVVATESS